MTEGALLEMCPPARMESAVLTGARVSTVLVLSLEHSDGMYPTSPHKARPSSSARLALRRAVLRSLCVVLLHRMPRGRRNITLLSLLFALFSLMSSFFKHLQNCAVCHPNVSAEHNSAMSQRLGGIIDMTGIVIEKGIVAHPG